VAEDLLNGLISLEKAREDYGSIVDKALELAKR
jgi:hypothetical protein